VFSVFGCQFGEIKLCEGVQNTHYSSGATDDATDGWLLQGQRDPVWPVPFSVAVSVRPNQ